MYICCREVQVLSGDFALVCLCEISRCCECECAVCFEVLPIEYSPIDLCREVAVRMEIPKGIRSGRVCQIAIQCNG